DGAGHRHPDERHRWKPEPARRDLPGPAGEPARALSASPLLQLHGNFLDRRRLLNQATLHHEGAEAGVAAVIQSEGALGKARQGVDPSLAVQLIIEIRVGADEELPAFLWMVGEMERARFHRFQEA